MRWRLIGPASWEMMVARGQRCLGMTSVDGLHVRDDDADHGADVFVQSLARGFSVVKAFGPNKGKLTIADVAKACGLTRAGARRILLTLEKLGYVGVEGRHFFLTARILDLGQGFQAQPVWEA